MGDPRSLTSSGRGSRLIRVKKEIAFAKGHATENDFLIIHDPDGSIDLTADEVTRLCDRRAGLGADGVLRVVRAGNLGVAIPGVDPAWWFMDYRNADGSLAEMCGNGVRVFAHWLAAHQLVDIPDFTIGTRAGARPVTVVSADRDDAVVRVDMGPAEITGISTCMIGDRSFAGMGVDLGNPHLACVVPGLTPAALEIMALQAPVFDTSFFPHGVNVELVTELAAGPDGATIHMRVWERGVGETRSCGTGTVAATRAALADAGHAEGTVTVRVPGGAVEVEILGDTSTLTGPSRIVATGTVRI